MGWFGELPPVSIRLDHRRAVSTAEPQCVVPEPLDIAVVVMRKYNPAMDDDYPWGREERSKRVKGKVAPFTDVAVAP